MINSNRWRSRSKINTTFVTFSLGIKFEKNVQIFDLPFKFLFFVKLNLMTLKSSRNCFLWVSQTPFVHELSMWFFFDLLFSWLTKLIYIPGQFYILWKIFIFFFTIQHSNGYSFQKFDLLLEVKWIKIWRTLYLWGLKHNLMKICINYFHIHQEVTNIV